MQLYRIVIEETGWTWISFEVYLFDKQCWQLTQFVVVAAHLGRPLTYNNFPPLYNGECVNRCHVCTTDSLDFRFNSSTSRTNKTITLAHYYFTSHTKSSTASKWTWNLLGGGRYSCSHICTRFICRCKGSFLFKGFTILSMRAQALLAARSK